MITLSVLSLQYVKTSVQARVNGVVINPTNDAVQFAFPAPGVNPVPGDFKVGSWETTTGGAYYARCLVGPGGTVALTVGTYDVWVKVTDNPEIPVARIGNMRIS